MKIELTLVQECESEEPFKSMADRKQRQALVKELHLLKTDLFMKMVEDGMMPLRPGVKRLVSGSPLSPLACTQRIHTFSTDVLAMGAATMNQRSLCQLWLTEASFSEAVVLSAVLCEPSTPQNHDSHILPIGCM